MRFFDSHSHYNDEKFDEDREKILHEIYEAGITKIIVAGYDIESSKKAIDLSNKYDFIYAICGISPNDILKTENEIIKQIKEIEDIAKADKVVGIGEIGLDYHYDFSDRDTQMRFFRAQMDVAAEAGLPVIIHDREAHGDVFDVIHAYRGRVRGIIHSCSASAEQVREYVKMGWYISFSGVITFKNAAGILDSVRATPRDRILVETDCPYLSPVPMRGKLNHSGYLHYTAEKAAELLGMDYAEFCETEMANARTVFGI